MVPGDWGFRMGHFLKAGGRAEGPVSFTAEGHNGEVAKNLLGSHKSCTNIRRDEQCPLGTTTQSHPSIHTHMARQVCALTGAHSDQTIRVLFDGRRDVIKVQQTKQVRVCGVVHNGVPHIGQCNDQQQHKDVHDE